MNSHCICVGCLDTCSDSKFFCSTHLKTPKVYVKLIVNRGGIIISGTRFIVRKIGHTYIIKQTIDGPLLSSDLVDLIRTGINYENTVLSDVTCPVCKLVGFASEMNEYSCGHFLHHDCCTDCKECPACGTRGEKKHNEIKEPEEPTECVVCLSMVREEVLPCGHFVHRGCIARWGNELCPICRRTVKLPETYKWLLNSVKEKRRLENERSDHDVAVRLQRQFGF